MDNATILRLLVILYLPVCISAVLRSENILEDFREAESGQVTSPRYPANYSYYMEESTVIQVADGARIQLTFHDFDVEYEENCQYDNVIGDWMIRLHCVKLDKKNTLF